MARIIFRPGSRIRPAAVLSLIVLALIFTSPAHPGALSANLVISQVYGGGGNSGATYTNDFVELFNRGTVPVSLGGLSIQYASATGTGNFGSSTTQITELPAVTLQPGQYFLVQEAAGTGGTTSLVPDYIDATPINMSGTGGKVALVNSTTGLGCNGGSTPCSPAQLALIVDLIGWDGANFFETAAAPATTNTTAALRNGGGCMETDNNAADFTTGAPTPRNTGSPSNPCQAGLPTDPTGTGAADPASVLAGATTLLTVAVEPGTYPTSTGLGVVADLSAIGDSPTQIFYDDGTHGDAAAADLVFSFAAIVAPGTPSGTLSLPAAISDAQGRAGYAPIPLVIEPPVIAIHDIQGSGPVSPYAGHPVATTGIVTGIKYNGFFIQAPDGEVDADPDTSEGVFVFTSSAPPAAAASGNLVKVIGGVQEYVPSADPFSPPMTEIGGSPAVTLLSSGNALPAPATITAADTNPSGGLAQLEPREGMRVRVESLTAVSPTEGYITESSATATSSGVFVGVITGIARPFREPGIEEPTPPPAGAPTGVPRFDGNPERIRVDTDGQVGSTAVDVATGAVVTGLVGPLDYAYRTYTILPDPGTPPEVSGGLTIVPVPAPADSEFTVASFNMQRFYDTANDPIASDVVLTATAFANRLNKASLAIRGVMGTPDILGVQEVENLTTLQAIADKVNADALAAGEPDPAYQAFLVEGNDIGGIDVGFLVKSARVTVANVTQEGKDTTYIDPNTGLPALLNDRPPLVMEASVADLRGGPDYPVTVIVNHLRSLSGIDSETDGVRVRAKRLAQAEFLASLIQARQAANPDEHIVSVGDYNAFQFNDGYVDVIGAITGAPTPADQVVLPGPDLVDPNLTDLVNTVPPSGRYSYSFGGNAQELDHVLVTANLLPRVVGLAYARSDADFPEVLRNDPDRPERVSDHDASVAYFTMPSADIGIGVSASPDPALSGSALTYTLAVGNSAADPAFNVTVTDTLPEAVTLDAFVAPPGWTCLPGGGHDVTCSTWSLGAGSTAVITLTTTVACDLPDATRLTNIATVTTSTYDADLDNNTATFVSTVSNPPPAATSPVATPAVLWPANHKFLNVQVDYEATDNCGGPPVCTLGVTSNEPVNGPGDGNTATDWLVVDAHRIKLRAERAGGGSGRIYTIAVTCVDGVGNAATKTATVTVPKSQR